MKTILNKVTTTAAAAIAVLIGFAMAGLGLTVVAILVMFALAAVGLALIASPFVAASAATEETAQEVDPTVQEATPA